MSGSPLNWLPASAGTTLATHRPSPRPMNQVAEGLNQWERTALELAEERSQLG